MCAVELLVTVIGFISILRAADNTTANTTVYLENQCMKIPHKDKNTRTRMRAWMGVRFLMLPHTVAPH